LVCIAADAAWIGVEHFILHGGLADRVQKGIGVRVSSRMLAAQAGVPGPDLGRGQRDELYLPQFGQDQALQQALVQRTGARPEVALLEPLVGIPP
jgi:hypothetical protein